MFRRGAHSCDVMLCEGEDEPTRAMGIVCQDLPRSRRTHQSTCLFIKFISFYNHSSTHFVALIIAKIVEVNLNL